MTSSLIYGSLSANNGVKQSVYTEALMTMLQAIQKLNTVQRAMTQILAEHYNKLQIELFSWDKICLHDLWYIYVHVMCSRPQNT